MKILVTGYKGFVGSRLVNVLNKNGYDVSLFRGDILTDKIDKSYDIVYHLAAILDESNKDMKKVNIEGTKKVVEYCKKTGAKLIYLSSAGVLDFSHVSAADESAPYKPETQYEYSKMQAEKIILSSKINYVILRSTIIIGLTDYWRDIISIAKRDYPLIGNGENHFHIVYIDDVVDALVWAINQSGLYNIGGPDVLTYKEIYEILSGHKVKNTIPKWKAFLFAYIYMLFVTIFRKKAKIYKSPPYIRRLLKNRVLDINKIKDAGFTPKWTAEAAIKKIKEEIINENR